MVQTRAATKRIKASEQQQRDASSSKKRKTDDGQGQGLQKRPRRESVQLWQLNFDVLGHISEFIHPLDLLNLARTCKSLRRLLMDKSSAFMWRAARRQERGLPDCPTDLTEPEYAHLVFYTRCHGCGRHAKKILWQLRRRYCPDCRRTRLCTKQSCPTVVFFDHVIPIEVLSMQDFKGSWVDKEQLDAFMHDHRHSHNKEQLLRDRKKQCNAIALHADKCRGWELHRASEHRLDLEMRRQERSDEIFERLWQQGYESEIEFFGYSAIQNAHIMHFKTPKALTDEEWAELWPKWLKTMNNFRSVRLDIEVYWPRKKLLEIGYTNYVASPSTNAPTFDLLPHRTELFYFPPFQDVISAPEETEVDGKSFETAFEKLPGLVEEWKTQLVAELAELVKIPFHPAQGAVELVQTPTGIDKLRLACAIFDTNDTITHFPETFSTLRLRDDWRHGKEGASVLSKFQIKFLEEAAYVVYACGLDARVATVEDMDRLNARLRCLFCKSPCVWTWRTSLWHAQNCSLTKPDAQNRVEPRWGILGKEHLHKIEAVEASYKLTYLRAVRCLLCRPYIGDEQSQYEVDCHVVNRHGVDKKEVRIGEHYASVSMNDGRGMVEMVEEEGGKVTFRRLVRR